MLIDHGTFTTYQPVVPVIPPRPDCPYPVDEPDEGALQEHIDAYLSYVEAVQQYTAACEEWEANTEADRRKKAIVDAGGLFLRNESNIDWYSIAGTKTGNTFAILQGDVVISASDDPSTLFPIDCRVIETDDPVDIGYVLDGGSIGPRTIPIGEARKSKIAAAWAECQRRIEAGSVTVQTSAGSLTFGIDKWSQENIKSVLIGVALSVSPNPRPWTPKGSMSPVMLTHSDLTLVGGTMMAAVDGIIQAYLVHKAAISAMPTVEGVLAYSTDEDWPE